MMNQIRYRPIILVNLLALRTTVLVAEWALTHREWIARGKAYAPVIVSGFVAYFVGVVIGHAIVS
ncbi:MAG: hypothetical protein IH858_00260 [Chloroflexi bacterium]|nr:hypothetical protein [Chloroflexota bacterium]MCH8337267.1 hypothetical protein [Chloroflexota bacterium]